MTYFGIVITMHGILLSWNASLGGSAERSDEKLEYMGQLHGRQNRNPVELGRLFF